MVCFTYIIINTLHTGDNKDSDNDDDNNNNNNNNGFMGLFFSALSISHCNHLRLGVACKTVNET
jgi:hypothetical protein